MANPRTRTAAAAAALALGALAAPAFATGEDSATVAYSCAAPFGDAHPAVRYVVDQPPATVVAGQVLRLGTVATFALDEATTQQARAGLGWASLGGTVTTHPTGSRAGLHLSIAPTLLGNGPTGATNAPVSGTTILRPTAAGSDTLRLGDLGALVLHGFDASGAAVSTLRFPAAGGFGPCTNDASVTVVTNPAAGAPVVVKVVRDSTTMGTSASFSRARSRATVTVKVTSHFGLEPIGRVELRLKRGGHRVATRQARLDDHGVARATFSHLTRKGSYSVVGSYPGSDALEGSLGHTTFVVHRNGG